MKDYLSKVVVCAMLLWCGYILGIGTPPVQAYTQDETRLMNKMANELTGIRRALDKIASKVR